MKNMCGKCGVEMRRKAVTVIHNKTMEEIQCPKCGAVARLELY